MTQHVLQDVGRDLALCRARGCTVRQLVRLGRVGERDAAPLPSGLALLPGDVVECAATPQDGIQRLLLFRGGLEPIVVGFARALWLRAHLLCLPGPYLDCLAGLSPLRASRRSSPCLEAGVSDRPL
jgi:hypothetical protein